MSEQTKKSFLRWQGRTIEQLGFVNNLLIGLATAILAFNARLVFDNTIIIVSEKCWLISSLICVFLSMILGCYCALNRLWSFRITMRIAKQRETGKRESIEKNRCLVSNLDKVTWWMIILQATLFAVGGLLLVIISIIHLTV